MFTSDEQFKFHQEKFFVFALFVHRYTAISKKVVGKSARDNPERDCGWF